MVIHGSESWLNWGFPISLIIVPFLVCVFTIYFGLWLFDTCCWNFGIWDISINSTKDFV